jgi:pimeloyl-ACP methyl ester carboxylesterase
MPTVQVNGTSLYYEDTGSDGPPVLLCHGVLWSTAMFAAQIAHLRNTYRCVAYDHRGQGRSERGPIASDELARIKAPTRLLVGEEDMVTEPAASERLRANIPGATLVTLPHAGHMAPREAPDIINEEIAAFLAEVRG